MRSTLESTLPWWIAGPTLGLVIVCLLGLANKRFGVVGGVTDLVAGSSEGHGLHSWRALLVIGIFLGGLAYSLLTGAPEHRTPARRTPGSTPTSRSAARSRCSPARAC